MQASPHLKLKDLEDTLWQSALESIGTTEIDSACALSLRAWNTIGVLRMERQRRLTPEDIAEAKANLAKLVDLMKKEAVILGKPEHLDNAAFHAARRRLQRRASFTAFALWPFWPRSFVATN
jgi:hypothetical protein